jgi:hypothetical protein
MRREDVRDGAVGDGVHFLIVRLRPFALAPVRPSCFGRRRYRCRVGDQTATRRRESIDMPKVVITHAVQDIDRWLQGKAERAAAIESATASNVTDYVAQDGSKDVAITADVADIEPLKSMAAAPTAEALALMDAHGVVQPITIYIES